MVLTIISIWIGAIGIGVYGAASALSNRWVRALGVVVLAGLFTFSLLGSLRNGLATALFEAGDVFVWMAMLSPVVMWSILGAGTSLGWWKQRRLGAT